MSGARRDIAVFPPAPDTAETLRLECLRLAVATLPAPAEPARVVETAAAFFAFLRPRAAERLDLVPTVSP